MTALMAAMLAFLGDGAVLTQERRHHYSSGNEDYAAYVRPMEDHLKKKGLILPAWDPSQPVPEGFLAAKATDKGKPRRPLKPRKSRVPKIDPCAPGGLAALHDFVLEDLGGTADSEESSAAPLVWLFHAHLARLARACGTSGAIEKP